MDFQGNNGLVRGADVRHLKLWFEAWKNWEEQNWSKLEWPEDNLERPEMRSVRQSPREDKITKT